MPTIENVDACESHTHTHTFTIDNCSYVTNSLHTSNLLFYFSRKKCMMIFLKYQMSKRLPFRYLQNAWGSQLSWKLKNQRRDLIRNIKKKEKEETTRIHSYNMRTSKLLHPKHNVQYWWSKPIFHPILTKCRIQQQR